jgi:hypothetical protein
MRERCDPLYIAELIIDENVRTGSLGPLGT